MKGAMMQVPVKMTFHHGSLMHSLPANQSCSVFLMIVNMAWKLKRRVRHKVSLAMVGQTFSPFSRKPLKGISEVFPS